MKKLNRLVSFFMAMIIFLNSLSLPVYASLFENSTDKNEKILKELVEILGGEKTPEEIKEILKEYDLVDEKGNIKTNWDDEMYIYNKSHSITFDEVMNLADDVDIVINQRVVKVSVFKEAISYFEKIGILKKGNLVVDWNLKINDENVTTGEAYNRILQYLEKTYVSQNENKGLNVKVVNSKGEDSNKQEENKQEKDTQKEVVVEEDTQKETVSEENTQTEAVVEENNQKETVVEENAQKEVITEKNNPKEDIVTNNSYFEVKILDNIVDPKDCLLSMEFLNNYGMLIDVGTIGKIDIKTSSNKVKSNKAKIIKMLENDELDADTMIEVGKTSITARDLAIIYNIDKYTNYIKDTYFPDGLELTDTQKDDIKSIYEQLSRTGFMLYDRNGADELRFPSGINHDRVLTVKSSDINIENFTIENNSEINLKFVINNVKEESEKNDVSFNLNIIEQPWFSVGSYNKYVDFKDAIYNKANRTLEKDIKVSFKLKYGEHWNGTRPIVVNIYDIKGAVIDNNGEKQIATSTIVKVNGKYDYFDSKIMMYAFLNKVNIALPNGIYCNLHTKNAFNDYVNLGGDFKDKKQENPEYYVKEKVNNNISDVYNYLEKYNIISSYVPVYYSTELYDLNSKKIDAKKTKNAYVQGQVYLKKLDKKFVVGIRNSDVYRGRYTGSEGYKPSWGSGYYYYITECYNININEGDYSRKDEKLDKFVESIINDDILISIDNLDKGNLGNLNKIKLNTENFVSCTSNSYARNEYDWNRYSTEVLGSANITKQITYEYTNDPSIKQIIVPDSEYLKGEIIPIIIEFNTPVRSDLIELEINKKKLKPINNSSKEIADTKQIFLYEVGDEGVNYEFDFKLNGVQNLGKANKTGYKNIAISSNTNQKIHINHSGSRIYYALPNNNKKIVNDFYYKDGKTTANIDIIYDISQLPRELQNYYNTVVQDNDNKNLYSNKIIACIDNKRFVPIQMIEVDGKKDSIKINFDIDINEYVKNPDKIWVVEFYSLENGNKLENTIAIKDGKVDILEFNKLLQEKLLEDTKEIDSIDNIKVDDIKLALKADLIFGKYVSFALTPPVLLTKNDIVLDIPENYPKDPIYINDIPSDDALTLSYVIKDLTKSFTWTQTKWCVDNYILNKEINEFEKVEDDDYKVVEVDENGKIIPLNVGKADIYLKCLNGNIEEYADYTDKVSIVVQEGAKPYFKISEKEKEIVKGDSYVLRFVTNIVSKHENMQEPKNTTFTVNVYDGNYTKGEEKTPILTKNIVYDPSNKTDELWYKGSPKFALELNEDGKLFDSTSVDGYTITVETDLDESIVYDGDRHFYDDIRIFIKSKPISIKLERPDRAFFTNYDSNLSLSYKLENYDKNGKGAEFELIVTNNSTNEEILKLTDIDSLTGGNFTIDMSKVVIPDKFRTILDISVKAKNTTDKDYSRDSFTLYVYDRDALKIKFDEISKNGKDVVKYDKEKDVLKISNNDWIKSLSQEEILALDREINLNTDISINYDEHPYSSMLDSIKWKVKDNDIANVNYRLTEGYEDVEKLPYETYEPSEKFVLSGKKTGETSVIASHYLSKDVIKDELNINVETLKDKLCLLQIYPAMKAKATYINSKNEVKEIESDEKGRFAIYEELKIDSNIYIDAKLDGEVYIGTFYKNDLKTSEKSISNSKVYPLNTLKMKKASVLPIYLKNFEGKNFSGDINVRLGVYRNRDGKSYYCKDARYKTSRSENGLGKLGYEDNTIHINAPKNGKDGSKIEFYFDVDEFKDADNNPLNYEDSIEVVLEIVTNYNEPVLLNVNMQENEKDVIKFGENVVAFKKLESGIKNIKARIVKQTLYTEYTDKTYSLKDIKNKKLCLGPTEYIPEYQIDTYVAWDRLYDDKAKNRQSIMCTSDNKEFSIYSSDLDMYPFTKYIYDDIIIRLNQKQLENINLTKYGDVKGVKIKYILGLKEITSQSLGIAVANAYKNDYVLNLKKNNIREIFNNISDFYSKNEIPNENKIDNEIVAGATGQIIEKFNKDAKTNIIKFFNGSIPFVKIVPTENPFVYRGLITVSFADDSGLSYNGEINDYNNADNFTLYDEQLADVSKDNVNEAKFKARIDIFQGMPISPNIMNIIKWKESKQKYNDIKSQGQRDRKKLEKVFNDKEKRRKETKKRTKLTEDKTDYIFGGGISVECEFVYDPEIGWKTDVLGGGFSVTAGIQSRYNITSYILSFPVTMGLTFGVDSSVSYNNYLDLAHLTNIRLHLFCTAFYGLGWDYTVMAAKFGLFSTLDLILDLLFFKSNEFSFGTSLQLKGTLGLKLEYRLWLIKGDLILCQYSPSFEYKKNYDQTMDKWRKSKKENRIQRFIENDKKNSEVSGKIEKASNLYGDNYVVNRKLRTVDRNYLTDYKRSYNKNGPDYNNSGMMLFSIGNDIISNVDNDEINVEIISNTYPYAEPSITEDGEWLFYLTDLKDKNDVSKLRLAYAKKNIHGGYDARKDVLLDKENESYGDSQIKVFGKGDNVAVVWNRLTDRLPVTEPGQVVTSDVQKFMMDNTDVMLAMYDKDSDNWNITNLTKEIKNQSNISPVVTTNGDRVFVAWRNVDSNNKDNVFDFNTKDYILYSVSEDKGKTFTKPQPIYNGISGTVKGMTASMLDTGEISLVFTLEKEKPVNNIYKQEVLYCLIDKIDKKEELDEKTDEELDEIDKNENKEKLNIETTELKLEKENKVYDVVRYVQMTDNENLNENPQITHININNEEVFLISWYNIDEIGNKDIRFALVNKDGNRQLGFVDSLSSLVNINDIKIDSNYKFVTNANTINDLSILWCDNSISKDLDNKFRYLIGMKFREKDGKISVSAPQKIMKISLDTVINDINAYVQDSKIYGIFQGTVYDTKKFDTIDADIEGEVETIYVPKEKTSIFLGKGNYRNNYEVNVSEIKSDDVIKGIDLPIQFNIINKGIDDINKIDILFDGKSKTFTLKEPLKPNSRESIVLFYDIPDGKIKNPEFTVKVCFVNGDQLEDKVKAVIDIPDLGIVYKDAIIKQENGIRKLQFGLYNDSDSKLFGSNRYVKLEMYSDEGCTEPIDSKYFVTTPKTIINGDELKAIDDGHYTINYDFNIKDFINNEEIDGKSIYKDENGEIIDGGVDVYVKASVVEKVDGEEKLVEETNFVNNYKIVNISSLIKIFNGEHVNIEQSLNVDENMYTNVDVLLRNNSIVNSENGNIIVTLFDGDKVVDIKQSYGMENELSTGQKTKAKVETEMISLKPEEVKTFKFTFNKPATKAYVTYSDVVLDENNSELGDLFIEKIGKINNFKKINKNNYIYSTSVTDLLETNISAVSKNPNAVIKVNGINVKSGDFKNVKLAYGNNVIDIVVNSGKSKTTYTLQVFVNRTETKFDEKQTPHKEYPLNIKVVNENNEIIDNVTYKVLRENGSEVYNSNKDSKLKLKPGKYTLKLMDAKGYNVPKSDIDFELIRGVYRLISDVNYVYLPTNDTMIVKLYNDRKIEKKFKNKKSQNDVSKDKNAIKSKKVKDENADIIIENNDRDKKSKDTKDKVIKDNSVNNSNSKISNNNPSSDLNNSNSELVNEKTDKNIGMIFNDKEESKNSIKSKEDSKISDEKTDKSVDKENVKVQNKLIKILILSSIIIAIGGGTVYIIRRKKKLDNKK